MAINDRQRYMVTGSDDVGTPGTDWPISIVECTTDYASQNGSRKLLQTLTLLLSFSRKKLRVTQFDIHKMLSFKNYL